MARARKGSARDCRRNERLGCQAKDARNCKGLCTSCRKSRSAGKGFATIKLSHYPPSTLLDRTTRAPNSRMRESVRAPPPLHNFETRRVWIARPGNRGWRRHKLMQQLQALWLQSSRPEARPGLTAEPPKLMILCSAARRPSAVRRRPIPYTPCGGLSFSICSTMHPRNSQGKPRGCATCLALPCAYSPRRFPRAVRDSAHRQDDVCRPELGHDGGRAPALPATT